MAPRNEVRAETGGYGALLGDGGFQSFLWTQFLAAFNDNVYKMIVSVGAVELAANQLLGSRYLSIAGAVFVLPFLLFAGYAGQLADRFSKTRVLQVTKAFEIVIMLRRHRRSFDAQYRHAAGGSVPARDAGQLLQPSEIRHPSRNARRSTIDARQWIGGAFHFRCHRTRNQRGIVPVRALERRAAHYGRDAARNRHRWIADQSVHPQSPRFGLPPADAVESVRRSLDRRKAHLS